MVDLSAETEAGPLVLDLAGRLRMGDRVLPVVPATMIRGGVVVGVGATCTWRETALQSMRRRVR